MPMQRLDGKKRQSDKIERDAARCGHPRDTLRRGRPQY